jgi:hypothetical protein|tara:strand:- start:152 stop:358 length:207 start_codon:yes stop_codon:yes gene_type:complete
MPDQAKENIYSAETNKVLTDIKKPLSDRPNIDHLIKRILIERRKIHNRRVLIIAAITLGATVCMVFFF